MAISYISAASAASNSITIPTHQSGDLIVLIAFRSGSSTAPTVPSGQGWTTLSTDGSGGGQQNSAVLVYKFATSSSETSGTFTNATHISCGVYRGVASIGDEQTSGIGAGGTTSLVYPALTLQQTDNTSWVVGLIGVRNASNAESAPTGMTNRTSTATQPETALHDTNGAVTSWSQQTVTANSGTGYRSYSVELVAIPDPQTATAGAATATATAATPLAYISFAQTATGGVASATASGTTASVSIVPPALNNFRRAIALYAPAPSTGYERPTLLLPPIPPMQAGLVATGGVASVTAVGLNATGVPGNLNVAAAVATITAVGANATGVLGPLVVTGTTASVSALAEEAAVQTANSRSADHAFAIASGVQPTIVLGGVIATAGVASVTAVGTNAAAVIQFTQGATVASVSATGVNAGVVLGGLVAAADVAFAVAISEEPRVVAPVRPSPAVASAVGANPSVTVSAAIARSTVARVLAIAPFAGASNPSPFIGTVGQYTVNPFSGPVNRSTAVIDANEVRGNDDRLRQAMNLHESDPKVHLQSSSLAARPLPGVVGRFWVSVDNGFYSFWYDDGARWHEIGNDHLDIEVVCDQVDGIIAGDVVKVVGWNNGQNLPIVSRMSASTDVAFAIASESIAHNARGYVINTGIVTNLNTASFTAGNILYPDGTGGLTPTKPTSGSYQMCAYVLLAQANEGTLYVEFSGPRIVETASATASTVVLRDANGSTALQGLVLTSLPTSATGLPAGTVWSDGGTLKVV